MRYPPSFIERVKTHFRLSEVVGKRIELRRHGREFQACCPFHNEKTPSFTLNDEKNFYHCFGCGAHGDAIKFVMEYDRLHYKEAIEALANEGGIPIPAPDRVTQQHYDREAKLLGLMQAANEWFTKQLFSSVGHAARRYLQDRGIDEKTIQGFGIGYAPQNREGLKLAMLSNGYTENQMVDCGLLTKVDGKPTYDRFRGRVMFPIQRIDGKVIAFGGRLLEKSEYAPKYLNSPETALFKKHDVLFNMHNVKKVAHESPAIVVVEGYTDVISLHANGIPYAVAPLGTAFGESHLKQLWRYHHAPVMCFDGDKAGQKAMLRAADIAMPHIKPEQLLRFCGLPNGEDPDSYIRASGSEAFEKVLARALSISELLWNLYIGNRAFTTPEQLATAEHKLMSSLESISDETLKRRIESSFKNRLWHIGKGKKPAQQQDNTPDASSSLNLSRKANSTNALQLEQIFALVMRYPALLNETDVEHAFYEWDWTKTHYKDCVADIVNRIDELSSCRYVMAEFLSREFPAADAHLQKHYTQGVIPTVLYGKEEREGIGEAKRIFKRLQHKIEQSFVTHELQALVQKSKTDESGQQDKRLLELIKMQQKAHSMTSSVSDDTYS